MSKPDRIRSAATPSRRDDVLVLREALRSIVLRCDEGDTRTDWLPVIRRIASEALDQDAGAQDALADILDICEGWTRPMTPTMKVEAIKAVALKATDDGHG